MAARKTAKASGPIIEVRGAREHNLKNVNVELPRDKLIVFTGLSGSGKSSLAFDTIYAEGQRRYVESLSSYARQFLGQMDKPDVDVIEGLSPAISIDQKSASRNPRSTVGTITEVYDYLRLLYARIGIQHCPNDGTRLQRQTPQQIVDRILELDEGTRFQVLAPVVRGRKGEYDTLLDDLADRATCGPGSTARPSTSTSSSSATSAWRATRSTRSRSSSTAWCCARASSGGSPTRSRQRCAWPTAWPRSSRRREGEPRPETLTFSQHLACPSAARATRSRRPATSRSTRPTARARPVTASAPRSRSTPSWSSPIRSVARRRRDRPVAQRPHPVLHPHARVGRQRARHRPRRPVARRSRPSSRRSILHGVEGKLTVKYKNRYGRQPPYSTEYEGVIPWIKRRHEGAESDWSREQYEGYMRLVPCGACGGARLKPLTLAVTIDGKNISEVCDMSIGESAKFLAALELSERDRLIAERVTKEVNARLGFLLDVGLDYLTLSRSAGTLAGGEAQRIRLASQIGSGLVGTLYVLDEPSIGLHQRDNRRLIDTLTRLRDLGNTVIVVEHDEETIRESDWIVDIGPGAGEHGGEIVYAGRSTASARSSSRSPGQYLSGKKSIPVPRAAPPEAREGHGRTAPASTTCRTSTSTFRSAASSPSPACRVRASRRWSATSCCRC